MRYPALLIDTEKLKQNLALLSAAVHGSGCSLMIVTKSFCADSRIVDLLLASPEVDYIADSRVQNLRRIAHRANLTGRRKETVLLRLPQKSEIPDVVKYASLSLNSEVDTVRLLDTEARRQGKTHRVLLMIDLGDLREGLFYQDEKKILETAGQIIALPNIELYGLAVNLTCYGAVLPTRENLSILTGWAERIRRAFGVKCAMVSGGNSSSWHLIGRGELPPGINNLRLGEAFVLGNDTALGTRIEGVHHDAVTLEAQIVEIQTKPSLPIGKTNVDSFGGKPVIKDRGLIKRAVLAIGRQDIDPARLTPQDESLTVLGASSDHLILDIGASTRDYRVGGAVSFTMNYSALLRAFTSPYVFRRVFCRPTS